MNKKLVAILIVVALVGYLGCKLGCIVTEMAGDLDRTQITEIGK